MPADCRCHFSFFFHLCQLSPFRCRHAADFDYFRHAIAAAFIIDYAIAAFADIATPLITPLRRCCRHAFRQHAISCLMLLPLLAALRHISPLPPLFRFSFFHYA
jgi:hypothetical protein